MNALEIEDLRKIYSGGFEALKGISLSVKKGDFYALLGPNGAGKSTTIGIIASLVNKTSGRVSVFGHDIDNQLEEAKLNLGLVPQEFNFNQFETVEQIDYSAGRILWCFPGNREERAKRYLSQLDLWEKRKERARNLSGGDEAAINDSKSINA
ncbi:ABC transporter ATP-binding protein [Vibrio sp. PP-XX7]